MQRDCNVFGKPVYEKATDAEGKNPNISTWHYDSLGRVIRAVATGILMSMSMTKTDV